VTSARKRNAVFSCEYAFMKARIASSSAFESRTGGHEKILAIVESTEAGDTVLRI
jgi:hypothetical protein